MSDPRRRTADSFSEPRAKSLARPASDARRVAIALWNDDDRFAWLERVAILIADAGLSLEEAEQAAFVDVSKHRTGRR